MATYLADKSALALGDTRPEVRDVVEPLLLARRIATCGIVDLELLYSALELARFDGQVGLQPTQLRVV